MYDHKFIYKSRRHENDQLNTEEVYVSKVCKNERFILLNIIMMILYKYVKKYANKKGQQYLGGIFTVKITNHI